MNIQYVSASYEKRCDAPGTEPTEPWIAAGPDVLGFIARVTTLDKSHEWYWMWNMWTYLQHIETKTSPPLLKQLKPFNPRASLSLRGRASAAPSKPERHHLCDGHAWAAWAWIQDDHSSKHTSNAKVRILSLFCTQKSRFWNAPAMWTSGTLLLRGCPHSVPALSRCPSL